MKTISKSELRNQLWEKRSECVQLHNRIFRLEKLLSNNQNVIRSQSAEIEKLCNDNQLLKSVIESLKPHVDKTISIIKKP